MLIFQTNWPAYRCSLFLACCLVGVVCWVPARAELKGHGSYSEIPVFLDRLGPGSVRNGTLWRQPGGTWVLKADSEDCRPRLLFDVSFPLAQAGLAVLGSQPGSYYVRREDELHKVIGIMFLVRLAGAGSGAGVDDVSDVRLGLIIEGGSRTAPLAGEVVYFVRGAKAGETGHFFSAGCGTDLVGLTTRYYSY